MTTFARVVCVSVAALLALLLVIALPSEPLDQPEDHTLGGVAPVSLGPISSAIPAESSVLVPISNKPVLKARVAQDFDKLPFYFVENQGQLDEQVAFYIQGSDKTIYFAPDGVTFALTAPLTPTISPQEKSLDSRQLSADKPEMQEVQRWAVKLDFVGANPNVRPIGQDKTEAVISYFKGPQDQWYAGLPTYSRIVYRGLWPGIDLVYYGTVNQLKYEFIVHPGVDPNQIRLAYHGADVALNANGQLLVTTPLGELNDEKPVAYQDIDGQRVTVPMSYHISKGTNQSSSPTLYGFQLDPYDTSHPIILDPSMLVYCGYIGGSYYDEGWGTAVDSSGNVYVAGFTGSSQFSFPVTIGPDLVYHGGGDAFVAKVNATGTALIYAGYIGGADDDTGFRIAADQFGNAYITGWTFSDQNTFPILGGPDLTYNGGADAFVAKVNVTGTALVFSGYIGGADFDQGRGISVDATGNVYIAGITESDETTFPVTVGPDLTFNGGSTYGAEDAFVAKVNATGSALIYAGYIGGAGDDVGFRLATDGLGNAYVTGRTTSDQTTFPVTVGPDLTYNGGDPYGDAFVAKVNPIGTALIYAGYIGGSEGDYGRGIAVDRLGNAYVTGLTDSERSSFPVINGPDLTYNGYTDSFVVKVNVTGTALVYAGYIGGSGTDWGESIAVDSTGSAYVIGSTDSTQATFPVTAGPDLTYNGGYHDAFIVKVTESGTGLAYAGYLGGAGDDLGYGISVDNSGNAYVTGWTTSDQLTFPVTVGPDTTYNSEMTSNSGRDAFVAKVMGPGSGIVSVVGHHLERDGVIFEARGMNYFPKDYAWDRFWISYTLAPTQTNVELDQAKALGVNTVRIFLPYNLFDGTGQSASYLGYLEDFVSRLQARDMAALVTLFDYYPTYSTRPYSTTDYISSTRHISAVVNTLGVTNPAIMAWDIKNELDRDYAPYGKLKCKPGHLK